MKSIAFALLILPSIAAAPATEPLSTTAPTTTPAAPHLPAYAIEVPELKFDNVTVEEAIDILREKTHANIVVRRRIDDVSERDVSLDLNTRIKVHLWEANLAQALRVIFDMTQTGSLDFREEDGVVIISTPIDLDRGGAVTRVYDVRDLLDQSQMLALRHFQQIREVTGQDATKEIPTLEEQSDLLRSIVVKTVLPDSWQEAGGARGIIHEFGGQLVVTHLPSAHREIERLLREIRRSMNGATSQPAAVRADH